VTGVGVNGLEARGISVRLGGALVLDGVDAAFCAGEVTVILGPNGAGKSTLMGCLAGLRAAEAGDIFLNGAARGDLPARDLARRIGFLPQVADVHWDIDVATLVALGRYAHQGRWGASVDDVAAVEAAMMATDVLGFAGRAVKTLSGGERARVLLARVLAGEPEWLLADEPFANLDPAHQLEGMAALRQVSAAGAGVVVVVHDLNLALQLADRVLLLRGGRVVAAGTVDEVLTPALIGETYGIDVEMGRTAAGGRFIVTLGSLGNG